MTLLEARMPRISVRDVAARIRQITGGTDVSQYDIQSAYDSIMGAAEFENGMMVVYRGMTIDEPAWFADLKPGANLGRYWAYDSEGASVGSWDKPNVLITALVQPKNINWPVTIAQEIAIGGEYEITLGGVPVVLKAIKMLKGQEQDFSRLYGQQFHT
jgi:hypothetical protein